MRDSYTCFRVIASAMACLFVLGIAGCGDDNGTGTDTTPPTVSSTSPANSATNVSISANVSASFSEGMDQATINTSTFTLLQGVTPVAGAVTYSSNPGATFNPTNDLLPNTTYTATITTGAEDLAGNPLASAYVWSFTTGPTPDVTPPTVVSTIPADAATGVSIGAAIAATFSEPINPLSMSTSSFTLMQGSSPVAGAVGYAGVIATFVPSAALTPNTTYTATITTAVVDLSGNALAQAKVWSFTTAAGGDVTRPTVISTVPSNLATNVSVDASITAGFSEAMSGPTVNGSTFTLRQGSTAVAGVVTYGGTVATFNPTSNLAYNTLYTATITTGVTDAAGNALAVAYAWTFTTAAAPDVTAPTVTSTVPASGATGVSTNGSLTATFSEAMNPATINSGNFMLMQGTTEVTGSVSYSGNTLTFNPTSNLAAGAVHTATISTGVTDVAGNHLASAYVWSFTTASGPDGTAPTVVSTAPANSAVDVAVATTVSAQFSEAMDASTLNTFTFGLSQGGTSVVGVVTYSGTTATFTPSINLLTGLVYTATITTGARDLAGNAITAPYVWSFTTVGPTGPPPEVSSTSPVDEAVDVATVTNISATFNRPMNPATLNSSTFKVTDGGVDVPGSISYSGNTVTFNPSAMLATSRIYAAVITTGATDLAGIPLQIDFGWVFTTEANPHVAVTVPPDLSFNIPISANIAVSFDKPMNPATISTASFTVSAGSGAISGVVTYSGVSAVFNPSSNLSPNTLYTGRVNTLVTDVSGNAMLADSVWTFTTGSTIDVSAPSITGSAPADGATGVNRGADIRVFFNDRMDPSTLTPATITLRQGATVIPGTVTYSDLQIADFRPDADLAAGTVYTVTVSTAVRDISGNALASEVVWSFTTGP